MKFVLCVHSLFCFFVQNVLVSVEQYKYLFFEFAVVHIGRIARPSCIYYSMNEYICF